VAPEDRLQIRRLLKRPVRLLRTPAIGEVKCRKFDQLSPPGQDLLGLLTAWQGVTPTIVSDPAAFTERLVDRHDLRPGDAPGLGRANVAVDHVVIAIPYAGSARIGGKAIQIDMRVFGLVGVLKRWLRERTHVHQDNECLCIRRVSMNPIGLGPQVRRGAARTRHPARQRHPGIRVVHQVKAEDAGMSEIGAHRVNEGSVHTLALANPH